MNQDNNKKILQNRLQEGSQSSLLAHTKYLVIRYTLQPEQLQVQVYKNSRNKNDYSIFH